jgi:hypothetical protein
MSSPSLASHARRAGRFIGGIADEAGDEGVHRPS